MIIKPLNTLVVVKSLRKETVANNSGIYVSEDGNSFFSKFEVLAVGDLVDKVKVGMIVIAHDVMELVDPVEKIGFITQDHIFGEIEE